MDEKYVMDFSLFRVAKQLRLLGCDVACDHTVRHTQVINIAKAENRIIVTASKKFVPHIEALQRADRKEYPGDPRYKFGEYIPPLPDPNKPRTPPPARRVVKKDSAGRRIQALASGSEGGSSGKKQDEKEEEKAPPAAVHIDPELGPDRNDASAEKERIPTPQSEEGQHRIPQQPPNGTAKTKQRRLTGYNSEGESEYEDASDDGEDDVAATTAAGAANVGDTSAGEADEENLLELSDHEDLNGDEADDATDDDHSEDSDEEQEEKYGIKHIAQHRRHGGHMAASAETEENEAGVDDAELQARRVAAAVASFENREDWPLRYIVVNPFDSFRVQVEAVVRRMRIEWDPKRVFSRCVQCNGVIMPVDNKSEVEPDVHETVFRLYNNFYRCRSCQRVYWGMDEGVLVNYKALRTVEHAKAMCMRARADPATLPSKLNKPLINPGHVPSCHTEWGNMPLGGVQPMRGLRVHLYAYPRNIKCTVLSFLSFSDHDVLLQAYPVFSELVGVVQRGDSWSFKPEKRKKRDGVRGTIRQ